MKHLKTFENINDSLQIGDYVICECNSYTSGEINDFLKNNIGKYVKYITNNKSVVENFRYAIEYDNVPHELCQYSSIFSNESGIANICMRVNISEIIYFSKNKKDLEVIIKSNQYNL